MNPKVVVTTKHRGVFFGELIERNRTEHGTEVVLADARVCIYWTQETCGFVGLAATGPLDGCRISRAAPRLEVLDVTSILTCSEEAIAVWEASKWN